MARATVLGLAAAVVLAAGSFAAAEGLRWELGVKTDVPQWIRVAGAGDATSIAWYMTYEVENKTGAERKPAVRAEIRTETGKKHPDTGDPLTLEAVKKRLGVKEIATASDLRNGIADGAKVKCVATFGQVDKYAHALELRVYGLQDPITMVKGKQVFEVRYWQVKYKRTGDEFRRTEDPWEVVSSGWVTEEPTADR